MSVVVVVQVKLELVADQAMVVVGSGVVRSRMAELATWDFQKYSRTDMPELQLAAAPEACCKTQHSCGDWHSHWG